MRVGQVDAGEKVLVTYGSGRGKELSADDGVRGACGIGDLDRHVTADLPDEVGARGEGACGPRVERGARTEVDDTHSLDALPLVPVEQVERELVGVAVGDGGVEREAGGRIPAGGDAVGGVLRFDGCASIVGRAGPGVEGGT
jgi:hypothetical protein